MLNFEKLFDEKLQPACTVTLGDFQCWIKIMVV